MGIYNQEPEVLYGIVGGGEGRDAGFSSLARECR